MENRVIDSEHMNFNGKNFARLSYEMLFEEQEAEERPSAGSQSGEPRESGDPQQVINEQELVERLRKVEKEWQNRLAREKEEAAGAAYEEGREKGRQEGLEEALAAMSEQVESIRKALDEADRQIAEMLEELKPTMAQMVFELAEKVIQVPLDNKHMRDRVREEIREILEELEQGIRVKVAVSTSDYEMVEKMLKDRGGHVELKASGELSPGEYTVDTRHERVVRHFNKILKDFRESVALTGDRPMDEVA